jgi:hypothetical protein
MPAWLNGKRQRVQTPKVASSNLAAGTKFVIGISVHESWACPVEPESGLLSRATGFDSLTGHLRKERVIPQMAQGGEATSYVVLGGFDSLVCDKRWRRGAEARAEANRRGVWRL